VSSNRGKTIYVSNLRRDLTERYLEKKFSKFGDIKGIEIVMDPFTRESRGFGFITYETSKAANLAIEKMHRRELKKRALTVEMSRRGKPRVKTPGKYMGRLGG
jgi:RNA recognition motif-containing protein